jgi:hypothetical protein
MDAFEFLESLPNATLERLYEDPWACQAVFQALPPLAQQFVVRLLPFDVPVTRATLASWLHAEPGSPGDASAPSDPTDGASSTIHPVQKRMPPAFHVAIHKLTRLRVFAVAGNDTYQLHAAFQRQLRVPSLPSLLIPLAGL